MRHRPIGPWIGGSSATACERGILRITYTLIAAALILIAAILSFPSSLTAQDTELTALRGEIGVDPEPGTLLAAAARLSIDRMPLAEALVQLAQSSRIQIAFSPSLLPPERVVDCACATQNVARTLDRLLAGTGLGYVELGAQVIIVLRAAREALPPDMVERAELRSGGFPAEFGGRTSSVLFVESDVGDGTLGVDAGLGLISSRVAVRGGLAPGIRDGLGLAAARWKVSARRSYWDLVARLTDSAFPYTLADLQAVFEGWTKGGDRVRINAYSGRDRISLRELDFLFTSVESVVDELDPDPGAGWNVRWPWGNDAVGASWTHLMPGGGTLEVHGSYSRFGARFNFTEYEDTRIETEIAQSSVGADLELRPTSRTRWKSGLAATQREGRNVSAGVPPIFQNSESSGWESSAYTQLTWTPSRPWLLEAGLRWDGWQPQGGPREAVPSPRVAVKRFLGDGRWAVRVAGGRQTQYLHSLRDERLPIGMDAWVLSGEHVPAVVSDQIQAGVEGFFGSDREWFASAEGYLRTFDGVIAQNWADDPTDPADDLLAGDGRSIGIDALLRKDAGRTRGWVSASLLKATRSFEDTDAGRAALPMRSAGMRRLLTLLGMVAGAAGCDVTDVPPGSGHKTLVALATVVLTVDPAEPSRMDIRAVALVSEAYQQVLVEVPGAAVRIIGASGRSLSLVEEEDPLGACTVLPEDLYGTDEPLGIIGSCHTATVEPALFAPGEALTLTVTTPDGSVLEGTSRMPDVFVPRGLSVEDGRCRVEPNTGYRFTWAPVAGTWAHVGEAEVSGLSPALWAASDPLYLPVTVLGRGRDVTDMVFPGDFLLELLSDVDNVELHRTLDAGFPRGARAEVTIAALDRNWANWIREGRFNINGEIVIPSVFGDGTGMFGTAVRWKVSVESRVADGAGDVPLCGTGVAG